MLDLHHHILPKFYVQALRAQGVSESGGSPFPAWDEQEAYELLDRQQIRAAVLSVSSPGIFFGDQAAANLLARQLNEYLGGLVAQRPARYGALATLPLPDVDAALRELEFALDTLRLDGVCLLANVAGEYLGTPRWRPLYEELHRRRAVVVLHPNDVPAAPQQRGLNVPGFVVDFPFDTTRAVANLLFEGVLERYDGIRWVLAHAGGAVPFLAWRLGFGRELAQPTVGERVRHAAAHALPGAPAPADPAAAHGALDLLSTLYYDTALSAAPFALRALQEVATPARVVFGTDYPYAQEPVVAETRRGLAEYNGFDARQLAAVLEENAVRLFPRLSARIAQAR